MHAQQYVYVITFGFSELQGHGLFGNEELCNTIKVLKLYDKTGLHYYASHL